MGDGAVPEVEPGLRTVEEEGRCGWRKVRVRSREARSCCCGVVWCVVRLPVASCWWLWDLESRLLVVRRGRPELQSTFTLSLSCGPKKLFNNRQAAPNSLDSLDTYARYGSVLPLLLYRRAGSVIASRISTAAAHCCIVKQFWAQSPVPSCWMADQPRAATGCRGRLARDEGFLEKGRRVQQGRLQTAITLNLGLGDLTRAAHPLLRPVTHTNNSTEANQQRCQDASII